MDQQQWSYNESPAVSRQPSRYAPQQHMTTPQHAPRDAGLPQQIKQDPYASLDPRFKIGNALEEPLREHNIVPRSEMRKVVGDMLE